MVHVEFYYISMKSNYRNLLEENLESRGEFGSKYVNVLWDAPQGVEKVYQCVVTVGHGKLLIKTYLQQHVFVVHIVAFIVKINDENGFDCRLFANVRVISLFYMCTHDNFVVPCVFLSGVNSIEIKWEYHSNKSILYTALIILPLALTNLWYVSGEGGWLMLIEFKSILFCGNLVLLYFFHILLNGTILCLLLLYFN